VGALVGGWVYQHLGAGVTFAGASVLAAAAGLVAWFALAIPALDDPLVAEPAIATPDGPLP